GHGGRGEPGDGGGGGWRGGGARLALGGAGGRGGSGGVIPLAGVSCELEFDMPIFPLPTLDLVVVVDTGAAKLPALVENVREIGQLLDEYAQPMDLHLAVVGSPEPFLALRGLLAGRLADALARMVQV